jgi:hypothetical protein
MGGLPIRSSSANFKESGATQRWGWGVWTESVLDPSGDAPAPSDAQVFASIVITRLEE